MHLKKKKNSIVTDYKNEKTATLKRLENLVYDFDTITLDFLIVDSKKEMFQKNIETIKQHISELNQKQIKLKLPEPILNNGVKSKENRKERKTRLESIRNNTKSKEL